MDQKSIQFTDYDKISDVLMWFSPSKYQLKFNVKLKKVSNNNTINFHNEYYYYNKALDRNGLSIKRDYQYFYSIEKLKGDFKDNIDLKPCDIELLKIFIKSQIYPLFIGNKNVFGIDRDNKLCLKKAIKPKVFTLSQTSFISFVPVVFYYSETETNQGMKICINDKDNWFEVPLEVFLNFANIILNTDMVNAAMTMLNYVKTKPYGVNLNSFNS